MTIFQQCENALTGSACSEKANELFYVSHQKAPKPLMGPFLSHSDAELGRAVMRSTEAFVSSCTVESVDEPTYQRCVSNGRIVQVFAARISRPLTSNEEPTKCL